MGRDRWSECVSVNHHRERMGEEATLFPRLVSLVSSYV